MDFNQQLTPSVIILSALEFLGKKEVYNIKTTLKINKIIIKYNNFSEMKNYLTYYPKWLINYIQKIEANIT